METRVIKFGIVGLRRGMDLMLDSLDDPNLRVTAICDRNLEKMEEEHHHHHDEEHCCCGHHGEHHHHHEEEHH